MDNTETRAAADKTPSKLTDTELVTRVRKRFCLMEEADRENRRNAMDDMRFVHVPGAQWQKEIKEARGTRPCYEFNKLRIKEKRVVNEMRANRPSGKVRAVENGDLATANVIEGIGRNILQVSDFDTIADYAGLYQVGGGAGAWRVATEWVDDGFDQEILVKAIPNVFNLYWDPASVDSLHRDAADWVLLDSLSNAAFDEEYPDRTKVNFEGGLTFKDEADWKSGEMTRIAEYHWKEPYKKRLIKLVSGEVLDADDPASQAIPLEQIKDTRVATCHRIYSACVSGDSVLKKPTLLKGKYHRFVVVHGEWFIVDNKVYWMGMTRYGKDAQRAYNVASTAVTETIASTPNSHYWVTAAQAKGHQDQWKKAVAENLPFLLYNDTQGGQAPQRSGGADVPVALVQEQQIRDQELKDVVGVYDASLGDRSNEASGRAITRRNEQGQIVNYNFPDNMGKAKQLTVTIVNDLIGYYYDAERTVRTIGINGAEEYIKVNTKGFDAKGNPVLIHDLSRGKYDVTVTVGPSYATQRQEAAETYAAMAPQDPLLMQTSADIVYDAMDLPGAKEIAERRAAMLPPQIQALKKQGKDLPPEVRQAKAMLDAQQQQVQEQGQLVQAAAGELEQKKAELTNAEAQAKVARAQYDTDVATKNGALAKREADLVLREAQVIAKETAAGAAGPRTVVKRGRAKRVNGEIQLEVIESPMPAIGAGVQPGGGPG